MLARLCHVRLIMHQTAPGAAPPRVRTCRRTLTAKNALARSAADSSAPSPAAPDEGSTAVGAPGWQWSAGPGSCVERNEAQRSSWQTDTVQKALRYTAAAVKRRCCKEEGRGQILMSPAHELVGRDGTRRTDAGLRAHRAGLGVSAGRLGQDERRQAPQSERCEEDCCTHTCGPQEG